MSPDVARILQQFIDRIDQFEPEAPELAVLEIGTERMIIREPVARALAEALAAYHDPRDNGSCAHCATGRLDTNFQCRSCGAVQGVFGQTLASFLDRNQG